MTHMTEPSDAKPSEPVMVYVDPAMQRIVPAFLGNTRVDLQTISEALARRDYDVIRDLGHSIKGVGGFGFGHIGEAGLSLEQAAKARDSGRIQNLIAGLSDYLERVVVTYTP